MNPDSPAMAAAPEATILFPHQLALFAVSVIILAAVFELVRRRFLKERYALLWIAIALGGFALGAFPGLIEWLSAVFRLQFITVLFIIYFAFTFALVLSFSVMLSRLSEHNRTLAQEIALLGAEVRALRGEGGSHDA